MEEQRKLFSDVIFELLKDSDHFDKSHYMMLRVWDLMYKRVPKFKTLAASTQFFICETTLLVHFGSCSATMRHARIITKPAPSTSEIDFYPEYGYEETQRIQLKEQRKLC